jgi:hypothetical protein
VHSIDFPPLSLRKSCNSWGNFSSCTASHSSKEPLTMRKAYNNASKVLYRTHLRICRTLARIGPELAIGVPVRTQLFLFIYCFYSSTSIATRGTVLAHFCIFVAFTQIRPDGTTNMGIFAFLLEDWASLRIATRDGTGCPHVFLQNANDSTVWVNEARTSPLFYCIVLRCCTVGYRFLVAVAHTSFR